MELRQLQYAVQLASDKNFSRAAEKLHIAQPSLSQQLSKLEKEIGVLLFQRSTSSVELTSAGEAFIEKAQKVLDMVDQLYKEMDDISNLRKGKLIVGSLPITGSHLLPPVLPVFHKRYPQVEVVLVEESSTTLEQLTAKGQTDLTLLSLPLYEQSLEYESLIEEEICLAVPPDSELAKKQTAKIKAIEIAALADQPFIVLKRGQGFRALTFDLCQQAGFSPRIVFESSNIETIQSLVAAGMGIALVPKMVTRPIGSGLAPHYCMLAGRPHRTLAIAYRKNRYLSQAARAFIHTMKEVLGQSR